MNSSGRVTQRAAAKPLEKLQQRVVRLPPEAWAVTRWDAFPGYISRAERKACRASLERSRRRVLSGGGRRRDGAALLSGLILAGRCGQRMQVVSSGTDNQHVTYICCHRQRCYAEPVCRRMPGREVDQRTAEGVLATLTPAQIELRLAVGQEVERQPAEPRRRWQAETTAWTDRKALLQLLVADVTLTWQESEVLVQIRRRTNELEACTVPLPIRGAPPVPTTVVERVHALSQTPTDAHIADELNQAGIPTSQRKPCVAQHAQGLRRRYGIHERPSSSDHEYGSKGALRQ